MAQMYVGVASLQRLFQLFEKTPPRLKGIVKSRSKKVVEQAPSPHTVTL